MELVRDRTRRSANFRGEPFSADETVTLDFGNEGRTTCYLSYGESDGGTREEELRRMGKVYAELMRDAGFR